MDNLKEIISRITCNIRPISDEIKKIEPFIETSASMLSLLIALFGAILIVRQLSKVNMSLKNDAQGRLFIQNAEIRTLIAQKPELRRYFFDGATIRKGQPKYDEVRTIAEMFANYMEHLSLQKPNLSKSDWKIWTGIIYDIYDTSPVIKDLLKEKEEWYCDALHQAINTGKKAEEKRKNKTEKKQKISNNESKGSE